MTDDTVTSVDTDDNLDAFEAEFYSTAKVEVSEPVEEEQVDDLGEDDLPATSEDTEEEEVETPEDSAEEDEEEEPAPKKNKVSARERIEQLNAKLREQERRETEYLRRMEQLEAAIKEKVKEEDVPLRDKLPEMAPNPDAKGENGEPLYPLGEFDPDYIKDLTKFSVEQELKAASERQARDAQERAIRQAQEQLKDEWISKLDKFEEEEPEVRSNIGNLVSTFENIDPGYGEYLAATLMSSDHGPQIMNYLSQNIGEAQKIVNSGPAAATLAIGRLEAKLSKGDAVEERKEKKVSKAPAPPEARTRGTNGKFAVRPDTDNLDAFEKEFFS